MVEISLWNVEINYERFYVILFCCFGHSDRATTGMKDFMSEVDRST